MPHETMSRTAKADGRTGLIRELRVIVGRRHLLTGRSAARYTIGYREGRGEAAAVVRPGSLVELWRVFKACVAADHLVITQAANTGLTGGSTPFGTYDRPVVVINTLRIAGVFPIRDGRQVVCLAGATLDRLEHVLAPLGRVPHSVIGSSCLGASVIGGVCNNSGGALVSRGPAYTRLALFAQVNEHGQVELRNHLGIHLGDESEKVLARLEQGDFLEEDIFGDDVPASARDYPEVVRDCEAATPARHNNDPSRLFEASGCAGKLLVFAVRLDTFPADDAATTFYIGTNREADLTEIRRRLLLECDALPIAAEYIHRDAFDLARMYGKDTVLAIRRLGTRRLPRLFALKACIDRTATRLPFLGPDVADRLLQRISRWLPDHLPPRVVAFRDRFEHHLLLKIPSPEASRVAALLARSLQQGASFTCSPKESELAFLHRFAVAGAAVRYRAVHAREVGGILALDVALRRNDTDWREQLPRDLSSQLVASLYYGHFLCHVFHQDYILARGTDPDALKQRMLALLDARGAAYPAEHNVGHAYQAEPCLEAHYRALDPRNQLNPGIGKTSRKRDWA